MQKVTVADVRTKTGTGKKGEWTLVIVKDKDGAEFTSFDKGLAGLGKGAVIEIDPEITAVDGKTKINIKEWKLVSEGQAPAKESNGGGGYKRDTDAIRLEYELKAQMQAVERASIESQTAYNGIIAALSAGKLSLENTYVGHALEWAGKKLKAPEPKLPEPIEKKPDKAPPKQNAPLLGDIPDFKDGIELVNYALKHGFTMEVIRKELSIEKPADIKAVGAAAAVLFGVPKNNPDPEGIFAEDKA